MLLSIYQSQRMFVNSESGTGPGPRERRGRPNVDLRVRDTVGEWVGSAPVYSDVTFWTLTEHDLADLLNPGVERG